MSKFNFYKESKEYMKGYSKWHFYTLLPFAYLRFKWLSRND